MNEANADFLLSLSPTFAVWLADAIVDANTKMTEDGLTREQAIKFLNENPRTITQLRERIRGILDWLQHPTTRKQNLRELSFAEAERKSKEWHDELKVQGGDINFQEPSENVVLKEYPENDNGVKYYWVYIPQSYCDVESRRMGHCGRTGASSLISLRSIRPYTETDTITDSHVTIAFDINDGYIYQAKGKRNQKPAEKYYPYLFDIVKLLLQGKLNYTLRLKYEAEVDYLNREKRVISKMIGDLDKIFEDSEIDAILLEIYKNESIIKLALVEKEVIDELKKQNDALIEQYLEKVKKYSLLKTIVDEFISSPRLMSNNYRKLEKELEEINNRLEEIEGIEISSFKGFSREYASSQDYGWQDMTKDEIKKLYEIDSEIFNDFAGRYMLYEAGMIDEIPSSEVIIEKDVKHIADLLDMDNIREDIFEDYFNGSVYEIYEPDFSYYYQNAGDYVEELKGSNYEDVIDKIVEITGLKKEVVKENGAKHYLVGDDEDFPKEDFDDIARAIANAMTEAEANFYSDVFYSKLKRSLEDLGEVVELSDTGVILKINLIDKLSVGAISSYMKDLDSENLEDVFWEAQIQGDIELPTFYLGDIFVDAENWQDYFDINNY